MLDAICCEAWEDRYLSFNAAWGENERMASMRNGQGDEWFLVFAGSAGAAVHVFLKGFFHELPRANPPDIYRGSPSTLAAHLEEAAFSMEDVTFGGFFAPELGWTLRGDEEAMGEHAILAGDPDAYRAYAAEYFELDLPPDAIAHVLRGAPLDDATLRALRSERTSDELEDDRSEIGY